MVCNICPVQGPQGNIIIYIFWREFHKLQQYQINVSRCKEQIEIILLALSLLNNFLYLL